MKPSDLLNDACETSLQVRTGIAGRATHGRVALHTVLLQSLFAYSGTSSVVFLGVLFGATLMESNKEHPSAAGDGLLRCFLTWDGRWYEQIASGGYNYDPQRQSSVAFYPGYPVAAAAVARITGIPTPCTLVIVSHLSFVVAIALLAIYAGARFATGPARAQHYVILALGLFPTTFYFRMAYSESLFLLLCVAAMLGIERRWRTVWVALVAGAATATRPVGVALLAPLMIYAWRTREEEVALGRKAWASAAARAMLLSARSVPLAFLACWGMLAYVAYQWWQFGEPLAFVKTQSHWGRPTDYVSAAERAWRLLTLAPFAAAYDPASPCYWGIHPPRNNALFNMMFINAGYFLAAAACVVIGAWKRWLNIGEVALSAVLLLIPYITQADRMCMASQARFASVVFPVYLVLSQILARLPAAVAALLFSLSAVMLAFYSALFVNWHWFF